MAPDEVTIPLYFAEELTSTLESVYYQNKALDLGDAYRTLGVEKDSQLTKRLKSQTEMLKAQIALAAEEDDDDEPTGSPVAV